MRRLVLIWIIAGPKAAMDFALHVILGPEDPPWDGRSIT